jgi:hypothetical protein
LSLGLSGTGRAQGQAKIWENYDFVPGSKVLFYTDFSEDRVGNFSRALKYGNGPAEVVERDGVKMLRSTGRSTMYINVGQPLPPRFTLEIDVLPTTHLIKDMIAVEGGRDFNRGAQSAEVTWSPTSTFLIGGGQAGGTSEKLVPQEVYAALVGGVTHVRLLFDESYFKMFVNERRVYNIPEMLFRRSADIRLFVLGSDEHPTFITGIRVAESDTDVMYDALSKNGRWATQGILFETGKADLKPESQPVLKEIAAALKQHADLKILIEGHTDNVGTPASNLALSDARAAAVKAALVSQHGAAGDRITTKGLGDTKPSAPNTTAAGRAQNRRVEVVKQ